MTFVIFDTEYTSWKGCLENGRADWQKEEIVQIAALKVDELTLEVVSEFNVYIKPVINPVLSDYFINLTGITNEKLADEGIDFVTAYQQFCEFAGEDVCYSHGWSLSTNDIADGEVMNENLAYNRLSDHKTPCYRNIAPWFKKQYAEKNIPIIKQCSGEIAKLLGCDEELRKLGLDTHNALYDVYSILSGLKFFGFRNEQMKMTVEIRELTARDLEKALPVIKEITELHIAEAPESFQAIEKADYLAYLQWIITGKDTFGYVAVYKNEIVGVVTVIEEERVGRVFTVNKYYEIIDLVVKSNCQKMGIGKLLCDEVFKRAQQNKIGAVDLQVFKFNEKAQKFYEHLGFEKVSTVMSLKIS